MTFVQVSLPASVAGMQRYLAGFCAHMSSFGPSGETLNQSQVFSPMKVTLPQPSSVVMKPQ